MVNFFERVFSKDKSAAPAPRLLGDAQRYQVPPEYRPYVDELTAIGNGQGFLSFKPGGLFNAQCRHIRAREIGMRLNMAGGSVLMRKVYDRVDCRNLRQLGAAWEGIGDWTA
jgi:hypothetical protein